MAGEISAILSSVERWTKGTNAKTADGRRVSARCSEAVCWCLNGALYRSGVDQQAAGRALNKAANARGFDGFIPFNDDPSTTFEMVRELLAECGL